MSSSTVVFISGAGRGIGRGLLAAYLARPNHTVIGSIRNTSSPQAADLKSLPAGAGSKLHIVAIESTSETDALNAVKEIQALGVSHIDLVIANAGVCPELVPFDRVSLKDIRWAFDVNALGPMLLYQATKPLLDKAKQPRWATIGSAAGSMHMVEEWKMGFFAAYPLSKAAVNMFTMSVHIANENWIAFTIHPGHVATDMGNEGARILGLEEAPVSLDESITKTVAVIDAATRETQGGKLIDTIENVVLPF